MTDIEQKALALVNEVLSKRHECLHEMLERDWSCWTGALCRAIERHEATKQEVERLNALITATADHWMTLQFKHPIQWEGAIDSAMAAACAEIVKLHEALTGIADHNRHGWTMQTEEARTALDALGFEIREKNDD